MKLQFKLERKDICSFCFVLLMMIYYTLQGSPLYFSTMRVLLGGAVVFGVLDTLQHYKLKWKSISVMFVFVTLVTLIFIKNHDTRLLISTLAIFVGMHVSSKFLFSWLFWIKLICYIFVLLAGGYNHINGVALHGGVLILLFIAYEKDNLNRNKIVGLWIAYILLAFYTKSGSMIICGGVALLLITFVKTNIIKKILLSKMSQMIFPIALIMNLFAALWYGQILFQEVHVTFPTISNAITSIVEILDIFTSSRISLTSYSLVRFGVSILGGNIDYSALQLYGGYFNLDSGMIWLIQGWGIVMTVAYMSLSVFMLNYLIKTKQCNLIIAAIVIALWAINEDMLLSAGTNFLFFVIGAGLNIKTRRKDWDLSHEYT